MPPVGLFGFVTNTIFVRGVIAAASASRSYALPSSAAGTPTAPIFQALIG